MIRLFASRMLLAWQVLVLLIIVWTSFEVPLRFCLNLPIDIWNIWVDYFIAIVFFIDIIIYYRIQPKISRKKFSYHFWFVIVDVISMVPFDILSSVLNMPILAFFQFLRLLRIFKLLRTYALLETLTSYLNFVKIFTVFCGVFTLIHWIACAWLYLNFNPNLDNVTLYITSLYWTVTTIATVGYGDITPKNNLTRLFAMGVMVLGIAFYGTVLGVISKLIAHADKHKEARKEKLHDLLLFMEYYQVPWELQNQVYSYYDHHVKKRMSEHDDKIISDLPKPLQRELRLHIRMKLLGRLAIFAHASKPMLKEISESLKQVFYRPGDQIIKKGDVGHELFVVDHGTLHVLDDKGSLLSKIEEGKCFGEVALLEETVRTAHVYAMTYCDLYTLSKEDFTRITEKFPSLLKDFQKVMLDRRIQ